MVHVFEADPTLRNKKITFSEFKEYLNQYYPSVSGTTFNGNVVINGDLTVTGATSVSDITFTDLVTLSGAIVQNSLYASGTVGAFTVTGVDSIFTSQVVGTGRFLNEISGHLITGNTIRATNVTGVSGVFTTAVTSNFVSGNTVQTNTINAISGIFTAEVSGQTITGNTIKVASITGISGVFTQRVYSPTITGDSVSATTGTFNTLVTSGHIVQDDLNVSGDLTVLGSTDLNTVTGNAAEFTTLKASTISGTSYVSGISIQGTSGTFVNISSTSGLFTYLSGTTVTGNIGQFTAVTGVSAGFTTITGQTVTGNIANFVSGIFTGTLSGELLQVGTFSPQTINAVSGVFTTELSGATVTGDALYFTSGTFQNLNAANMTFGNDQTISGSFTVIGAGSYGSGLLITGGVSGDGAYFNTITGQTITGNLGQFTSITAATGIFTSSLSGTSITGNTGQFTAITGETAGFTVVTGTTVTGTTANFVTVSGTTVTGDTGLFTDITGSTLYITTPSGASAALVCSGVVSGDASGFVIKGPLIILP